MDAQTSAELQVLLEGIPLPATRDELLTYARAQDAGMAPLLEPLPPGEYDRLDAVGQALTAAPSSPRPPQRLPQPESGKPPGGSAYLDPNEEPGWVRPSAPRDHPPQDALEKASQLKQKQKKRQKDE